MTYGYELVDLGDGEKEFSLEQPVVNFIRIDYQALLHFGEIEVVIETPFTLVTVTGATYELDPELRSSLGPFLALYPNTLMKATMSRRGDLHLIFQDGAQLSVPPHDEYEACEPGRVFVPTRRLQLAQFCSRICSRDATKPDGFDGIRWDEGEAFWLVRGPIWHSSTQAGIPPSALQNQCAGETRWAGSIPVRLRYWGSGQRAESLGPLRRQPCQGAHYGAQDGPDTAGGSAYV